MLFQNFDKIILHCGPHKTGTSAIQGAMRHAAARLAAHGIFYPDYIGQNLSDRMAGNHSLIAMQMQQSGQSLYDVAENFLDMKTDCKTLLLSAEGLCRKQTLNAALESLKGFQGQVQFLFYLRRYDEYCESAYAESVKRYATGPIDPETWTVNFKSILAPLVDQFGPQSLILRPYDKRQWSGPHIVDDFLSAIGCSLTSKNIHSGFTPGRFNARFPRQATHLLSNLSNRNDKKTVDAFFCDIQDELADGSSEFFMSPKQRKDLIQSKLNTDQPFFDQHGFGDLTLILGLNGLEETADWAPFEPDWEWQTKTLSRIINQLSLVVPDRPTDELEPKDKAVAMQELTTTGRLGRFLGIG